MGQFLRDVFANVLGNVIAALIKRLIHK
jgi:hypothetical protein